VDSIEAILQEEGDIEEVGVVEGTVVDMEVAMVVMEDTVNA
jgi:hypothetical protein